MGVEPFEEYHFWTGVKCIPLRTPGSIALKHSGPLLYGWPLALFSFTNNDHYVSNYIKISHYLGEKDQIEIYSQPGSRGFSLVLWNNI